MMGLRLALRAVALSWRASSPFGTGCPSTRDGLASPAEGRGPLVGRLHLFSRVMPLDARWARVLRLGSRSSRGDVRPSSGGVHLDARWARVCRGGARPSRETLASPRWTYADEVAKAFAFPAPTPTKKRETCGTPAQGRGPPVTSRPRSGCGVSPRRLHLQAAPARRGRDPFPHRALPHFLRSNRFPRREPVVPTATRIGSPRQSPLPP
jgi:hypothetical protein